MANPFAAETELFILSMLRDAPGGMYGLELVNNSGGKLKRGTVYVTLGRMEEKGYIKSRTDKHASHPGLPRPRYRIEALGQRALQAAELMGALPAGA